MAFVNFKPKNASSTNEAWQIENGFAKPTRSGRI